MMLILMVMMLNFDLTTHRKLRFSSGHEFPLPGLLPHFCSSEQQLPILVQQQNFLIETTSFDNCMQDSPLHTYNKHHHYNHHYLSLLSSSSSQLKIIIFKSPITATRRFESFLRLTNKRRSLWSRDLYWAGNEMSRSNVSHLRRGNAATILSEVTLACTCERSNKMSNKEHYQVLLHLNLFLTKFKTNISLFSLQYEPK